MVRGAYIVDDKDLNDFIRRVNLDFTVAISAYSWTENADIGDYRALVVTKWRVILS